MNSLCDPKAGASFGRDRRFAELIVLAIGLAAETAPDLVREALGKVFNLSAAENAGRRCIGVLAEVQQAAQQARFDLAEIRKELAETRKQLDAVDFALQELEKDRETHKQTGAGGVSPKTSLRVVPNGYQG